MRLTSLVLGLGLLAVPAGAFAQSYYTNSPYATTTSTQSYTQTPSYTYNVPIYNASNGYNTSTSTAYNSNASPLSLNQYIAGVNAPSYTYGGTQPYTFGANSSGGYGSVTVSQAQAIQADMARRAAMEQQGLSGMSAQQFASGQYGGMYQPQVDQYGQPVSDQQSLVNIINGQQQTVKKVYKYKKINDPLAAPPRLFNPDQ